MRSVWPAPLAQTPESLRGCLRASHGPHSAWTAIPWRGLPGTPICLLRQDVNQPAGSPLGSQQASHSRYPRSATQQRAARIPALCRAKGAAFVEAAPGARFRPLAVAVTRACEPRPALPGTLTNRLRSCSRWQVPAGLRQPTPARHPDHPGSARGQRQSAHQPQGLIISREIRRQPFAVTACLRDDAVGVHGAGAMRASTARSRRCKCRSPRGQKGVAATGTEFTISHRAGRGRPQGAGGPRPAAGPTSLPVSDLRCRPRLTARSWRAR
jgi:hypothetical protein